MVFEVQIDLVQEHPGVFSLFAVFHDPVVDGLQRHHQRRGAKLLSHLIQVKNHDPVGHIHIGVMGEHVQTALGDQFRRKGDLPRLRFRLLQHLPAPVGEQRSRSLAAEIGFEHAGCAAVDDGFVASAQDPGPHLLLQNTGDQLRLQRNGVFILVAFDHLQRIDMVHAVGRDLHHLAAKGAGQRAVFPFSVHNNNIVLRAQGHILYGTFHPHGFTGAGHAQIKGVGRHQPFAVADQRIF